MKTQIAPIFLWDSLADMIQVSNSQTTCGNSSKRNPTLVQKKVQVKEYSLQHSLQEKFLKPKCG